MVNQTYQLNSETTDFLEKLNHPLRQEIEALRHCILNANSALTENIKWNGPNYCFNGEDRITMRIQPPTLKHIQVIFHCGAKVKTQPTEIPIKDDFGILTWKSNDRAIATFKNLLEIESHETGLSIIIQAWIEATKIR